MTSPILEVENLRKVYQIKTGFLNRETVHALNGVSFSVQPQTTLGIVGETGCGKSTLAKILMQIVTPTEGEIRVGGQSSKNIPKDMYRKKFR
ncbi:MAG: ATP-binding cassette domain-containing protein [Bdellovibrionota bacterium]